MRGLPGTPPARHDDLAARSSLHGSGGNAGDGSAAPGRKSPRWSAERRASRVMGRAAPHSRGPVASRKRDNRHSAPVGAPPTPRWGGRERKSETRAQQRAAGTNNTALFDIVNRTGNGSFARRDFARSCPRGRSDTSRSRASGQVEKPTCVDLGATRHDRRPASYIALRESSRWIPALVPLALARSLHSAGTRDRRKRPSCMNLMQAAPRHGKQRLVE